MSDLRLLTCEFNCAEEWAGFDVFIERLINDSQRNYFERLLVTKFFLRVFWSSEKAG